ncbi:MAG: hypothetical protein DRO01_07705 [Thermoproteota archaeon]|nr:MAG: hypothetical protein DRO01_07705 [Candidatus Korarchaeota archaeon]
MNTIYKGYNISLEKQNGFNYEFKATPDISAISKLISDAQKSIVEQIENQLMEETIKTMRSDHLSSLYDMIYMERIKRGES